MLTEKLLINAAVTGIVPTRQDNPHTPITPDEIADDCARCAKAGASIFHLHARDEDEKPTYRADIYREIIRKVRRQCPDAVICVSTSGRVFTRFEQRAEALDLDGDAKPDMASLTLGSLNFPNQASVNDPAMIRRLAERMSERGIVPELEIFDFGMVDYAKYLISKGALREPFYFNLLLGSLGTLSASPFHLSVLAASLPGTAIWAGAGIGRFQLWVNAMAIAMGGHVRVGLEDNLYMDSDKRRPATNVGLIERVAGVARSVGREIYTPQEVRQKLGLRVT